MFKHLFVLLLLVAATVSVNTPAHAAALTVNYVDCWIYSYSGYNGYYTCYADVSGGTGSYVSYTWNVTSTRGNYSLITSTNTINRTCYTGVPVDGTFPYGEYFTVGVTVKDSAGATASGRSYRLHCGSPNP